MNVRFFLKLLSIMLIPILLLSPDMLYAQVNSLYKGDTIKISNPKYFINSFTGTFIDVKNDSLFFQINRKIMSLPLQRIKKLEVGRGEKSNVKKGALVGGLSCGLGLGLLATLSSWGDQEGLIILSPAEAFLAGFIPGALLGSTTGAMIGSGISTINWEEIVLSQLAYHRDSKKHDNILSPATDAHPFKNTLQESINKKKRWEISFILGTTSSGPAADIEEAMINSNYDDTSPPGFFGKGSKHPFSKTGFGESGLPWSISVTYKSKNPFNYGLIISNAPIGSSHGYHSNQGTYLQLNYIVSTVSPQIIFNRFNIVKLGIGPGLFFNKMERESGGERIESDKKFKLGALFQAELVYPTDTQFFVIIVG